MLSQLEEIREGALSKIIIKMQCQARRVLVHVTYQGKIAEKKGISSIQRNIRLYYTCRDWTWFKFYTMIKGEMGVLKKKQAEEERRRQMAEGLAKFQAILDQAAAEREAAAAINEGYKAKIAAYKAEIEGLAASAGEQAEAIVAAEHAAAKDKLAASAGSYDKLKNKAVVLTAETTAMKGNVVAIAALDKKAAAALVEKRELW